jgi:hypothetical protein
LPISTHDGQQRSTLLLIIGLTFLNFCFIPFTFLIEIFTLKSITYFAT